MARYCEALSDSFTAIPVIHRAAGDRSCSGMITSPIHTDIHTVSIRYTTTLTPVGRLEFGRFETKQRGLL